MCVVWKRTVGSQQQQPGVHAWKAPARIRLSGQGPPDPDRFIKERPANLGTVGMRVCFNCDRFFPDKIGEVFLLPLIFFILWLGSD
jgi:hypothetical protein